MMSKWVAAAGKVHNHYHFVGIAGAAAVIPNTLLVAPSFCCQPDNECCELVKTQTMIHVSCIDE